MRQQNELGLSLRLQNEQGFRLQKLKLQNKLESLPRKRLLESHKRKPESLMKPG